MADDRYSRAPSKPSEKPFPASPASDAGAFSDEDEELLRSVEREFGTAEHAAGTEGTGRPPAGGMIPLPELPPPPEHHPYLWLFRQIKRACVILGVVYLAYWGLSRLFAGAGKDSAPTDGGNVGLPHQSELAAEKSAALTEKLSEGRRRLASSDMGEGLKVLEELADDKPTSPQGQKAMLTLASTYRYQMNDEKNALRWYRRYLKENPDARDAAATSVRLAEYLNQLGRPDEARRLYEDVLSRFPDRQKEARAAAAALARMDKP
ncbi:MAG: tetratricopeptide repeat protein [Deltaproteobacteria bacterium]|nr:tetratricopeptide repeat protein [Deltaproteobacteria bacterium]